jgi:flagellar export protein FliJ
MGRDGDDRRHALRRCGGDVKRYRFRLEQVLRVRRLEEERERGEVLAARAETEAARRRVEEATEAYRVMAHVRGKMSPADLRRHQTLHELRALAVEAARRSEATSHELLEGTIERWRVAETKVRVLEQLDGRRRADHDLAVARAEEKEVDDIVTARFGARREADRTAAEDGTDHPGGTSGGAHP